jgi:hypothetical protein
MHLHRSTLLQYAMLRQSITVPNAFPDSCQLPTTVWRPGALLRTSMISYP